MTVVARTFASIPARSAVDTWSQIVALLAPDAASNARRELDSIGGVAASLIASEAMTSAILVTGSGPRVRVYCCYGDEAVEGDVVSESPLAFCATEGDWHLSLPAPKEDVAWAALTVATKAKRISVRDMADVTGSDTSDESEDTTTKAALPAANQGLVIDPSAFLRR